MFSGRTLGSAISVVVAAASLGAALEPSNCFDQSPSRADCVNLAPVRAAAADVSERTSQEAADRAPAKANVAAAPPTVPAASGGSASAAAAKEEPSLIERFTKGSWIQPAIGGVVGGAILGLLAWGTAYGFAMAWASIWPPLLIGVAAAVGLAVLFKLFSGV